jgi:hypothetical protein
VAVIRKRKPRSAGGNARYVVDYRDSSGTRRWETFTTYTAAEARLGEVLRESRRAAPSVIDPNITVGEYAAQWLTQTTGHVRPRTLRGYRDILDRYILPTHKTWKLRQIHRGHLRRHLDAHAAKGYGKNTLRLIRATWSVLLGDAVEDGLLAINLSASSGVAVGGERP